MPNASGASPMVAAGDAPEIEARFAEEARAAGLSLPSSARVSPRLAAVAVVVIVAASLAVGYSTNWFNLTRAAPNPYAELPGCNAGGTGIDVPTEAGASSTLAALWPALGAAFAASVGQCFSLATAPSASGFTALSTPSAGAPAALVGPLLPSPGLLANNTFDLPLVIAPVVVLVNLGGFARTVNLTGAALAGAYLGSISSWSATAFTSANPSLHSSLPVSPVYLTGPSSATDEFSAYLSEWNASFASTVGPSPNATWPAGLGANSTDALVALVASTPGAIGYAPAELCPTLPTEVLCAALQAGPGAFVAPDRPSVLAAGSLEANTTAARDGDWANVTGVAPTNSTVYPMVETTYAVLYRDLGDAYGGALSLNQSKWLIGFTFWVGSNTSGTAGEIAQGYGYYPLSLRLGQMSTDLALNVTYDGNWILLPSGSLNEGYDTDGAEGSPTDLF